MLRSVRLKPGVDVEFTPTLNEAGVASGQFIRWRYGLVEKMGGFVRYYPTSLGGISRDLLPWKDVNGNSRLAIGSTTSLKVLTSGSVQDITPQKTTTNTAPSFSTTNGSATVTIVDSNISNPSTNNAVFIDTPVAVGGIVLFGIYPIASVISSTSYTITAAQLATVTQTTSGQVPIFTTINGSSIVTVTLPNHGLVLGQTTTFLVSTTVGGVTISGNYVVQAPVTTNSYTITVNGLATSTVTTGVSSATIQTGGSGGTNGAAVLTVVGGTGTAATINATISGGAVTAINSIATAGSYTVFPTSPVSVTGGGALAGATLDLVPTQPGSENGGNCRFIYYIALGPSSPFSGWGVGTWGGGGWGTGQSTPAGSGTPITATDWSLINFGEVLIGCPAGDALYQWGPESAFQQAAVIVQAPIMADGIFLAQPQQIVVAWGASFNGIPNPLRLAWCDAGNFTNWTATSSDFAGGFTVPRGNQVVKAMQSANEFLAWTDLSLWVGFYVGQPDVFDFNELMVGCGLVGRKAAGVLGAVAYWMSQKQFFMKPVGGVPAPMACKVWDFVFQNIDTSNFQKVRFFSNAGFNEIGWYFPSLSGGGENDSYVKYNVLEGEWDAGLMGRSSWTDQSILGSPIGGAVNGILYQHDVGYDMDGAAMNPAIVTGTFRLNEGDDFQVVTEMIPDMRWGQLGGSQNATMLFTLYSQGFPADAQAGNKQQFGPFTVTQLSQFFEPYLRGRDMWMRIESQDLGSFWRMGLVRYRVAPDGRNPI